MISQLKSKEIDELVADSVIGTLICFDKNEKIKFPITYVKEGKYVYSYSKDLEKILLMRKDPAVLLKVFKVNGETGWSSANVLGIFEELKGVDAEIARVIIKDKLMACAIKDHSFQVHGLTPQYIRGVVETSDVIYRIHIIKKTGKSQSS